MPILLNKYMVIKNIIKNIRKSTTELTRKTVVGQSETSYAHLLALSSMFAVSGSQQNSRHPKIIKIIDLKSFFFFICVLLYLDYY